MSEKTVWVNNFQSKERRREKYRIAREAGLPPRLARRVRDWRDWYFERFIEFVKLNWYNRGR